MFAKLEVLKPSLNCAFDKMQQLDHTAEQSIYRVLPDVSETSKNIGEYSSLAYNSSLNYMDVKSKEITTYSSAGYNSAKNVVQNSLDSMWDNIMLHVSKN